jgi:hypothetical protein
LNVAAFSRLVKHVGQSIRDDRMELCLCERVSVCLGVLECVNIVLRWCVQWLGDLTRARQDTHLEVAVLV